MEFADGPDAAAFRERLRAWLAEHGPAHSAPADDVRQATMRWQRALHAGGWSGLSIPVAYGGGGLPPYFEGILNEEIARAGAPPILDSVYLAQIVLAMGTEQQREAWIPRMLSGEDWWCQGFSETEAGSDLAALRTRAVRDPAGGWRITGQKTWTTSGQWANQCLVLARTDTEVPKHKGISAFLVPTDAPGVEVRAIRQATGHSEFAELFLEDVHVPDDALIGDEGSGWRLAMMTVTIERGPSDNGYAAKHAKLLARLEAQAAETGRLSDPLVRRSLARCYVDVEVLRVRVLHSLADRASGMDVGAESSADKLLMIRTEQALHRLALTLAGPGAAIPEDPSWLEDYLFSRAVSVYGGTEQIQRDIIATRVLGLPRAG